MKVFLPSNFNVKKCNMAFSSKSNIYLKHFAPRNFLDLETAVQIKQLKLMQIYTTFPSNFTPASTPKIMNTKRQVEFENVKITLRFLHGVKTGYAQ